MHPVETEADDVPVPKPAKRTSRLYTEVDPGPEPAPVSPFDDDVYLLWWRPDCRPLWVNLSVQATLFSILAVAAVHTWPETQKLGFDGQVMAVTFCGLLGAMALGLAVFGPYSAVFLLLILEESASGRNHIRKPDWSFFWGLHRLAQLLWIVLVSIAPGALLAAPLTKLIASQATYAVGGVLGLLLFPMLLLSALSSDNVWSVISPTFVTRLKGRLDVLQAFYATWFLVSLVCLLPSVLLIANGVMPAAPACGVALAAWLIISFRLFGRLAWLLTCTRKH